MLSVLVCRAVNPLPTDIGVELPLELLLRKGFLLPPPPAECIIDAGMVTLRFACDSGAGVLKPKMSFEGVEKMAWPALAASVGSGIDGSWGCGASCG